MNSDPNNGQTVDDGIHAMLHSGKEKAIHCLERWEDEVRRHPAKAVLGAVAAGYLLHRLPVRSLLAAKIKLIGALAPPAILAYGAAKLAESLQRAAAERSARSGPLDPGI